MNNSEFITKIAAYVQKHAASFGIRVHSPIIAQGILESASGGSELAKNANNFFGLKWRENRCPTSNGFYIKEGSEQNIDGSYSSSAMKWFSFPDMESCVIGYFDFTNTANYANLKGVTDPETYLRNIKEDGYATSINYVENLLNVIKKYDLTKYDNHVMEGKNMLKIAIDAGHGLYTAGKRCMKSLDPNETREWSLNSEIAEQLQCILTSYECETFRVDDPTGKNDVSLNERCNKANARKADVYISIHHNAGVGGGAGGGTMVFYYSSKAERAAQAQKLYDSIVNYTKLRGNRSEKVKKNKFAVLAGTNMPAFLIENGFMDSSTDVPIILQADHMIKTAHGIEMFLVNAFGMKKKPQEIATQEKKEEATAQTPPASSGVPYVVNITASALNVRAGAGTGNKIIGCITDDQKAIKDNPKYYFPKTKYTITEEKSGWGKLKSGAGWISLKYTEKA